MVNTIFGLVFNLILIKVVLTPRRLFTSAIVTRFSGNTMARRDKLEIGSGVVRVRNEGVFNVCSVGCTFAGMGSKGLSVAILHSNGEARLGGVAFGASRTRKVACLG